ncbi:MAG: transposase [Acidobacteria bacterium]|nr:transposase [Acidobacteriota bacterium]
MKAETTTTRTVKRISLELNRDKFAKIEGVANAYRDEKRVHLEWYQGEGRFALARNSRAYRDGLTADGYATDRPLSARGVNLAIKDAFETEEKYWAAIAAGISIRDRKWSAGQMHYANWLMCAPQRFSELILGRAPIDKRIALSLVERKQVQNYLRRQTRKLMGRRPSARTARSFALDPGMYRVFEQNGRQYISITSLEKGQRLVIPLEGKSAIRGNLRIVLLPEERKVEVHVAFPIARESAASGETAAIDVGLTEVAVDEEGNCYGEKFGRVVSRQTEENKEKNQKRNKLHALEKKYDQRSSKKKVRNLRRFNLGRKKLKARKRRARIEQTNLINQAIAEFLEKRRPARFAAEKLDLRRKAKSKQMSRRSAMWMRSTLAERIEFKASAAGCRRQHVNPAYTSQTCPQCGYVDGANRKGDRFQCRYCGHEGHSDQVAAINQKARLDDREITPLTPKEKVKAILLERFDARVEGQRTTVPGRTSERGSSRTSPRQSKNETAAGKSTKPAVKEL